MGLLYNYKKPNMKNIRLISSFCLLLTTFSCSNNHKPIAETTSAQTNLNAERLKIYAPVKLISDLSHLTENEKKMIALFIEAAKEMNEIFKQQSYGNLDSLLSTINDSATRELVKINYGPWDRLNGDSSFVSGIGEKPLGATFYPTDMTKEEFEKLNATDKKSLYTVLRRNEKKELITVPYHIAYKQQVDKAANLLNQAAELSEDADLKHYLKLRAEALLTDNYTASDIAWLDMKKNNIDIVIGPIENYEDKLFGYKAANEAYVFIKDKEWSKKLERYVSFLPELQASLPVDEKYKKESPGTDSELNAYDVVYYAGDCNAGSKTIAVNLPNDEEIQVKKGTRRSQLKNAMRAKFDKILVPIANTLIAEDQRKHITFDAFFGNTMFHEVAHGLGIKQTINGKGTVREALKDKFSALEEGKADILGLYMETKLYEKGEIKEGEVMDTYVTFLAGIFRSVRFGASSAHGKANMLRFNYFAEKGAFSRDAATGTYRVDFEKMKEAMNSLSTLIITLQGNGDYDGVTKLMEEKGNIGPDLQKELNKLSGLGIPVDIVFEQGTEVLGL